VTKRVFLGLDGGFPVAKPEWGVKRICPNCGTRYYDLRKDPPICPSCATPFDPEALLKSRRARPAPVDDTKKTPAPKEDEGLDTETEEEVLDTEETEEEVAVEDIDAEEDAHEDDVLIEDTSELGEDDMDEVVEVDNPEEEER
jgi:uncharacterized protein (TIGR02300 family)